MSDQSGTADSQAALLRIAGRVARMGGWTIDLPERILTWSDETCAIHDLPPGYTPVMDGVATMQALRRINPNLPIIGSSGNAPEKVRAQAWTGDVRYWIAPDDALTSKWHAT